MTDVAAYLDRLGLVGEAAPTEAWLLRLHLTHLSSVPFENLDIHADVPIVLETERLLDKLVTRRRGGYCYEVNGAFAWLLREVGLEVSLAQCRVHEGDDGFSPPFDHLALLVRLPEDDPDDAPWLVDVGFGDSFTLPCRLGWDWSEPAGRFRTRRVDDTWHLERDRGDGWAPQFALDPTPRALDEFAPRSRWHETSPDSPFRRRPMATLVTPTGRVTIAGHRLIVTTDGDRDERELPDASERRAAVGAWFGPAVADAVEAALSR